MRAHLAPKRSIAICTFALLVTTVPAVSHAQGRDAATVARAVSPTAATPRVRGLLRLALEYGGDKVGEFEYEDGSTPDVQAGSGGIAAAGVSAEVARRGQHALDLQGTLGVKWRTIPAATNQDLHWLRFPLEALLFYRAPNGLRVGGGTAVHLANRLTASGAVLDGRVSFANTPGFLIQAEYGRRNVGFDLRYTSLEYEVADRRGDPIDASSVGVGLTFFFGRAASR